MAIFSVSENWALINLVITNFGYTYVEKNDTLGLEKRTSPKKWYFCSGVLSDVPESLKIVCERIQVPVANLNLLGTVLPSVEGWVENRKKAKWGASISA